jgi:hypothetical protein
MMLTLNQRSKLQRYSSSPPKLHYARALSASPGRKIKRRTLTTFERSLLAAVTLLVLLVLLLLIAAKLHVY